MNYQTIRDAALVRDALGLYSRPPQYGSQAGVLVALSGLPGVGKSHFAARLAGKLPCVVLESDRIRKLLVARPRYTGQEHGRVFSVCHLLVEECLANGHRVVFDATNLGEAARRPLRRICRRLSVPLLWVSVTAPLDIVKQRLVGRDAGNPDGFSDAGWDVYQRFAPNEQPVSNPDFIVDSSGDTTSIVDEVARRAAAAVPGEPVAGGPQTLSSRRQTLTG